MPENKKEERLSKKDKVIYGALAALLILLIIISISLNYKLNKAITSIGSKMTELENQVSGQSDSQFISLSEELEITKANIFSCDKSENCESLFYNRKYTCPSSLSPTCVDKFCVCE